MNRHSAAEVGRKRQRLAGNRLFHRDRVEYESTQEDAEREDEKCRVRRQLSRRRCGEIHIHRGRDETVEERHQHAADHREHDSLHRHLPAAALLEFVRECVHQNGDCDQGDAGEKQHRVPVGIAEMVHHHAENQREADPDRKRHRHPRDRDRRRQQQIGGVEHHASGERAADVPPVRLPQVRQETPALRAEAAERKPGQNAQQQNAEHVVPVEKFITPVPPGQFLGVSPGTPAEHRDYAEKNGEAVVFDEKHGSPPRFTCIRGGTERRTAPPSGSRRSSRRGRRGRSRPAAPFLPRGRPPARR